MTATANTRKQTEAETRKQKAPEGARNSLAPMASNGDEEANRTRQTIGQIHMAMGFDQVKKRRVSRFF
jgi:hypothetical protein